MKIYLAPQFKTADNGDGGIRRVVDAQRKYLPQFGIELVNSIEQADLTAGHVDAMPIKAGAPYVEHCHGAMWSDYDWQGDWVRDVNKSVVNAIKQADAYTVPSKWVAHALSYGILKTPTVIYHGIESSEWQHKESHRGYVLWNKARVDSVSDVTELEKLAEKMHAVEFVSTFGRASHNVRVIGKQTYQLHKRIVRQAEVYLATARETFGIGTLEALAAGVPVAGWDYGGQSEIIIHGETGYLAPYGDYDALAECVNECIADRAYLSANCIADANARWQWVDRIEEYAKLYQMVLANYHRSPKVSVIVPCHNLGRFLPDALASVKKQTLRDWECIIVDDASTDDTEAIAREFANADARFKYMRPAENLKLSRALNFGHARSNGKYVINLDADNILPPLTFEILSAALDTRRDLSIVYGALDTMDEDGTNRRPNAFPYPTFSWYEQIAHLNQLHSSAMMRREVIEQSGGYRERQWRAEDAELWARATSFGFNAGRVTNEATLVYRWRADSKSMLESRENKDRDGDWCEYLPWRTAENAEMGRKQIEINPQAYCNASLVPFAAQGERTDKSFWDVYHHESPLVSVIIPVGPKHLRYLPDALDSLVGQTMHEWEAVVINDTGDDWTSVPGAPFARVIRNDTGKHNAGIARNIGLSKARAPFVLFLDADDMLDPRAIVKMLKRYAVGDVGYVYCDARLETGRNEYQIITAADYNQRAFFRKGVHAQTVLMATEHARQIGFDETMIAWEDWDFFLRCAVAGICGARVAEPLLTYRKNLGTRSNTGYDMRDKLFAELKERYKEYDLGAKQMAGCCGGYKKAIDVLAKSQTMTARVDTLDKPVPQGYTRLKYTGARQSPLVFSVNGRRYTAGATDKWRFVDALDADVERLVAMNVFVKTAYKPPVAPPPQAEPIKTDPKPPTATVIPTIAPSAPHKVTQDEMDAAIKAMASAGAIDVAVAEPVVIPCKESEPTPEPIAKTKRGKRK